MKLAGVEMTSPPVATEVGVIRLHHKDDGSVFWYALADEAGSRPVAKSANGPTTPLEAAADLAGLFDLDATVAYYAERITKGTLKQADSADGRRFLFQHVGV